MEIISFASEKQKWWYEIRIQISIKFYKECPSVLRHYKQN